MSTCLFNLFLFGAAPHFAMAEINIAFSQNGRRWLPY